MAAGRQVNSDADFNRGTAGKRTMARQNAFDCRDFEHNVTAYLDGEALRTIVDQCEHHLLRCRRCANSFVATRNTIRWARLSMGERDRPSQQQVDQIQRRVRDLIADAPRTHTNP
jgi:hypothetical protein